MSIIVGIIIAAVSYFIGLCSGGVFRANDEECPYVEDCPRYQRYKFRIGKNSFPEEEEG